VWKKLTARYHEGGCGSDGPASADNVNRIERTSENGGVENVGEAYVLDMT
jgi:hypothetical protein